MTPQQELDRDIRRIAHVLGQKPSETARRIGEEANRRHVRPLIVARERIATLRSPGTPRAIMNQCRAKGHLANLDPDSQLEVCRAVKYAFKHNIPLKDAINAYGAKMKRKGCRDRQLDTNIEELTNV